MKELEFENELISYLQTVSETTQWRYEPQIKTIDDLWQNFRDILNRHNIGRLGGVPLTDGEFAQIKAVINGLRTPYEAGSWLYGMNGKTFVEIDRDVPNEASLDGRAILEVFDQDAVGAGNTVYQIVNQIQRPHVKPGRRDSRFDTTLLINGLPIIHIEEKADGHDAMEAFEQIHAYIDAGAFTEIYSTVQIFVGMTPHMARYMANTTAEDFNKAFAFRWQYEDTNKPVLNWKDFCRLMLSIPMAHQMATSFMILDSDPHHRKLMVMRPYQVYATKRVINAVQSHDFEFGSKEIGYVWHTTGSGKTISSFKTAWLASRLSCVNKVVFVVDRIALTDQTYEKYQAYDPDASDESEGIIADTAHTGELARKLKSSEKSNSIIITSIQKLARLVKRDKFKAPNINILFIVDEAHRSTNGDMMASIKKAFPRSGWVGYTGTPAFDGDLTYKVFGPLLHAYTIREAIADRNVLGFKVDFQNTLSEDELKEQLLPEKIREQHEDWSDRKIENRIARMSPDEVDQYIDTGIYDNNPEHVQAVVDDILKYWRNRSHDGRYSAMLTTHVGGGKASSNMAKMYYDEFQKRNEERIKDGKAPLAVALTYSFGTDNSEGMTEKNAGLRTAMQQYNAQFGTNFDDTSVDEYFRDVTARLKGELDGPKLDLVIVIDQLLTGFDAKMVNTLYVDRTLSGANLIQAYSRTNRIDNFEDKPDGRIVNYRWPQTSRRLMDAALSVYANSDSALVQGTLPESDPGETDGGLQRAGVLSQTHEELIKAAHRELDVLKDLTENITAPPASEVAQAKLFEVFQQFNATISKLKEEDSFDYDNPTKLYEELGISQDEERQLIAIVMDTRRSTADGDDSSSLRFDLDFHVQHISEVTVNYDYINELLAKLINAKHSGDEEDTEQAFQAVAHALDQMEDRTQAQKYQGLAAGILDGSVEIAETSYPVEPGSIPGIMKGYASNSRRKEILEFREEWGLVDVTMSVELIKTMLKRHAIGVDDLNLNGERQDLVREGLRYYAEDARNESIRNLSRIKYSNALSKALTVFADHIVSYYGN